MERVEGRILLQINSCVTKSTGRIVQQIGDVFVEAGGKSYIAYSAREQSCECKSILIRIGTRFSIFAHALESLLFDRHGLGSRLATYYLIRKIKKISPDIIHLHNIHGYFVNYKMLFSFLSKYGKPVIWTMHDCWSITGHCAHFDNIGCSKWKSGCNSCSIIKSYPKSLLLDNSYNNYNNKRRCFNLVDNLTVVCVSHWLSGILSQSFLKNYPNVIINNGIDLNVFRYYSSGLRDKLNIREDKFFILGVGTNWSNDKGLKEFRELSKNKQYKIVLVGINDDIKKDLPDSIITIKRTNNQKELALYYSAADVLLNPTYNDSFPTINIESIACGTPVITYQTGGSPEIIDEKTGIVVPKGNYDELLKAISIVRSKGKEFYSPYCRERAETLFNKEDRFHDYLKLYQRVMK